MGSKTPKISRRAALRKLGVVGSGTFLATGRVVAANGKERGEGRKVGLLKSFDPDDKDEVRWAIETIASLKEKLARKVWDDLRTEQREAITDGVKVHGVERGVDRKDTNSIQLTVVSRVYGGLGQTLVRFEHTVHWDGCGGDVCEFFAYHSADSPDPLWSFKGVTTDEESNFDDHAISVKEGHFKACLFGGLGCIDSATIGSRITSYPDLSYGYRYL